MFQKILDKTDLIMYIKNRNNKQSITTETTMDNNTNNKFNKFNNHIKNVLCYLVFEFGYGTRAKQKSDVIPRSVESVFKPEHSRKTGTKWSHSDATLTYGLDNHRKPYATLTIRKAHIDIPVLPERKMAKLIAYHIETLTA